MLKSLNHIVNAFLCSILVIFSIASNAGAQVLSNRPRDDVLYRKLVSSCIAEISPEKLNLLNPDDANVLKKAERILHYFDSTSGMFQYTTPSPLGFGNVVQKKIPAVDIASCVVTASAISEALGRNGEVEQKQLKDLQAQVILITTEVKRLRERVEEDIFKVLNK